jgi:acyl-CoA synthetase (NDP forming)
MTTKRVSEAAKRRARAAERAALNEALGMLPEPQGAPASERYAATTGELWCWVAERDEVEAADRIAPRWRQD